ncbi:hypothetical protein [Pseudoalteromonas sp. Angola-7]|uniref:hypothetical protein n=1 Tax=Pseudoalteromonas sp. Angola-7 TaxID=3025336 RepID=UPI0023598B8E|nr:hypothetical protein [Pseudoalteromonas sp. Angola-7]MDC9529673.1 hypothetical protein [Pseudoalteromonas sp. Angola-7]
MTKDKVNFIIFFTVFFFPLFPTVMVNSQVHINILVFLLSILYLKHYKNSVDFTGNKYVIGYYLTLLLLLSVSFIFDIANLEVSFGSGFSYLRPLMLLIVTIAAIDAVKNSDFVCNKRLALIVIISTLYVFVELALNSRPYFHELVFDLYKREFRFELLFYAVSFFGTSYYSGYAFLILFFLALINYNKYQKTILGFFLVVLTSILVLLSQSKSMIFSLFICIYFYIFLKSKSLSVKSILFFVPFFIVSLFFINKELISELLLSTELRSLKSLDTLLMNTSNSGTLNVRFEQIISAFNSAYEKSIFFGSGLGRDESLESLPAVYFFRYGLLSIFFHYFIVLVIVIFSFIKMYELRKSDDFIYPLVVFLWAFTLPLTQFSGVMVEMSKLSYMSALMVGYILKLRGLSAE